MAKSTTSFAKRDPRLMGENNPMKGIAKINLKHARDVHFLARRFTKRAIKTIFDIMMDKDGKAENRLRAAEVLLTRGWGTPNHTINPIEGMSKEEMKEAAQRLRGMYGPKTTVTINSDKTVVMPDNGVTSSLITNGSSHSSSHSNSDGSIAQIEEHASDDFPNGKDHK